MSLTASIRRVAQPCSSPWMATVQIEGQKPVDLPCAREDELAEVVAHVLRLNERGVSPSGKPAGKGRGK